MIYYFHFRLAYIIYNDFNVSCFCKCSASNLVKNPHTPYLNHFLSFPYNSLNFSSFGSSSCVSSSQQEVFLGRRHPTKFCLLNAWLSGRDITEPQWSSYRDIDRGGVLLKPETLFLLLKEHTHVNKWIWPFQTPQHVKYFKEKRDISPLHFL